MKTVNLTVVFGNRSVRLNKTKWLIVLGAASLFTLHSAEADTDIVNNLTTTAADVSGLKNAADSSYGQGFKANITGDLASLVLDLGVQSNSGSQSSGLFTSPTETMSLYLYSANSSGTPVSELATLATGITAAEVENSASYPINPTTLAPNTSDPNYLGYTQNNDSFIYQYSVTSSLLSDPALVAGDYYAIVMSVSNPGSNGIQDIGWAEESGSTEPPPAGEVGELDPVDGYGLMEVDVAPEPSSWVLGLGACLLFVGLRYGHRLALNRAD